MPARISDVRTALRALARDDAQRWAGSDNIISRADEKKQPASWRPELARDAAREARKLEKKGGRVTVDETADHLVSQAEEVWKRFNASSPDELSPAELDEMEREFPQIAALTRRAVEQAEENERLGHPERVETLAELRALPLEGRQVLLDEDSSASRFPNLRHVPAKGADELMGMKRAFAEKLQGWLEDEVGDLPDDGFGHIGSPQASFVLFVLPSGEIAGGKVSMFQQGFDRDSSTDPDPPWHFDTPDEARAAGFDPTDDISWSSDAVFDADGNSLNSTGYWEWTGW